ncbi:hypothetical protein ACCAA_670013 [Candidatus Accumulibacter aalborgensis]|uniref:Uncharacterized protein n=1 Tax=Candidatus Accumulibacter aalborgensis TaxID=1860102 RepID=A0A1A8XYE5_9PROT|nr:hypothetical protein ACCAA_670013 [Candidatus Accumulibacter aalborgensis]
MTAGGRFVPNRKLEARVAASVGGLNAVAPHFQAAVDVPRGGVLFALPALLAVGLLEGGEELTLPPGYYGIDGMLMLIAFMALARLESVESLRSCAPGEWGKLLGLDRIPEVRTLREKIVLLSQGDHTERLVTRGIPSLAFNPAQPVASPLADTSACTRMAGSTRRKREPTPT